MGCELPANRQRTRAGLLRFIVPIVIVTSLGLIPGICDAQEISRAIQTKRSLHFIVHTDMLPAETDKLLERLEEIVEQCSDYWRRRSRGPIECFVVEDLKNWSPEAIPHPMGALIVDRIGGVTLLAQEGAGIQARSKVIVLASSRLGVAEHEAVHAYCGQAFGLTGPAWYREGIAQVFAYGQRQEAGVRCPPEMLAQLKSCAPKPISEIVRGTAFTQGLGDSLLGKLKDQQNLVGMDPLANWNDSDIRELDQLKEAYAWSWLACHLLHQNPNYQSRFKSLGQSYLARQTDTFSELFDPVMDELAFEYDFTLRHFDLGYRVDLCRWDWDKRFRCAEHGRSVSVRVSAARGYQASGLYVTGGYGYQFKTSGTWQTNPQTTATGAGGDPQGYGRLEGIVMKGYQLSAPFDLGDEGKFLAPVDGRLYLRCRDEWSQIGDNDGSVIVALGRAK